MQVKAKSKKISDLKAYLDAERDRLQREISSSRPSTDQRRAGYGNHMADHATAPMAFASIAAGRSTWLVCGRSRWPRSASPARAAWKATSAKLRECRLSGKVMVYGSISPFDAVIAGC